MNLVHRQFCFIGGNIILSKRTSKALLSCLISVILLCGCASIQQKKDKDLKTNFTEYKGYIKAGRMAIAKQEYIDAIDNYSKAIELSPFESSHYYYRGIAWYKKGTRSGQLRISVNQFC